jgi:uncharacterized protein (DUF1800 family)
MTNQDGPWAPFQPTPQDPWDLRKVAHLHRRAGFGATWGELQRDLRAGPAASVDRLLTPPEATTEERQVLDSLRQGVLSSGDSERLKAWWLYRMLYDTDPLREKLTLFWHSHFATSNRKVQNIGLMLQQNELLRRHALGEFAPLLTDIVSDPAMLIWLDGAISRRERPNENFAREFLELFTLGAGNYTEADIRQAARAFTGWARAGDNNRGRFNNLTTFRFDASRFDDGEKTFFGRTGNWNATDIVRITLEQPRAAEFLCRKLYRYFVSEVGEPTPQLIAPLAAALREHRYSIRHVAGIILRSRQFYAQAARFQRIKSPVEFSVGLLRTLEVPRGNVRVLALAVACDRQGQELFYPPNVRGWVAGRTWINSTTVLERGNWANDVVWGNADLGIPRYEPAAWAMQNAVAARGTVESLIDLLLQDGLSADDRTLVLRAAGDGSPDRLRRALQLLVHCPHYQLA